jgi:hypothetical protein
MRGQGTRRYEEIRGDTRRYEEIREGKRHEGASTYKIDKDG